MLDLDRHNMIEILLKVAINIITINPTLYLEYKQHYLLSRIELFPVECIKFITLPNS